LARQILRSSGAVLISDRFDTFAGQECSKAK
jgi:hypothetical protein